MPGDAFDDPGGGRPVGVVSTCGCSTFARSGRLASFSSFSLTLSARSQLEEGEVTYLRSYIEPCNNLQSNPEAFCWEGVSFGLSEDLNDCSEQEDHEPRDEQSHVIALQ